MRHWLLAGLLATTLPALAVAADATTSELVCENSESRLAPSPDGKWVAKVQEEACVTPNGAAAGITVILESTQPPERRKRVFIMPVPRSRDDWARVRWLGPTALEVRVPNLAEPAPPDPEFAGIRITLAHCGDNPDDRARLAAYREAVKQWQKDVTAWAAKRKEDPASVGPRPDRPQEPRLDPGRCRD